MKMFIIIMLFGVVGGLSGYTVAKYYEESKEPVEMLGEFEERCFELGGMIIVEDDTVSCSLEFTENVDYRDI